MCFFKKKSSKIEEVIKSLIPVILFNYRPNVLYMKLQDEFRLNVVLGDLNSKNSEQT